MVYKRCNDPDHEGDRYLPVTEFHKQGKRNNKQSYSSKCKVCKNRYSRYLYSIDKKGSWPPDKKRAYSRARSRALSKLAKLTPELYGQVLEEELLKEPHDFSSRGKTYPKRY